MTYAEYDALPGVHFSSLKTLAISPLRFWWDHVRPDREPVEPTPEMEIGTALHSLVLTPKDFDAQYYPELDVSGVEGLLVTMDDLRGYCGARGVAIPSGSNKRKEDLVRFVSGLSGPPAILDALQSSHEAANAGKRQFKLDDWRRIQGMAAALREEPVVQQYLAAGEPEVVLQGVGAETSVPIKARLDWMAPDVTLDLKSFSQKREKPIDKSINDAIWWEKYHWQAFLYAELRGWPDTWHGDHVLAFVESEAPFEVRIRTLRPKTGHNANLYWLRARQEIRALLNTYKDCMHDFGVEKPWRWAQRATLLADEDLTGMAFS